ncbi:Gag-pro-like protein [Cucumis melo var. makuwa]|uniref:Gag-pro-like protein n=1 Tax=Cucumis melo var. makuwa TaxID=1194695 RepID=A0A5A7UCV8_CUCMM|nr:Gag-pro-like protein [Cucumis melo var. makuwa]
MVTIRDTRIAFNGKRKVILDTARSSNPAQDTYDPIYPPGFTQCHMNVSQSQTTQHYIATNPLLVVPPPVSNIEQFEAQAKVQDMGKNENIPAKQKLDVLEERLQTIEGTDVYGNIDATQLCLVLGLIIPVKFKVHEFDKYDGSLCPRSHLIMCCRKMVAHISNDKLVIHCFQDSLTGPISRCSDCLDLQRMEKKSSESFKEYAQRWRDMVQSRLINKK